MADLITRPELESRIIEQIATYLRSVEDPESGQTLFLQGLSAGLMITLDDKAWFKTDQALDSLWDRAVERIINDLPPLKPSAVQVFRVDGEGNTVLVN